MSVSQRDYVRLIWPQCSSDRQRIDVIHDGIERGVIRRRRTLSTPRGYARWLFRDAVTKGWHNVPPQRAMYFSDLATIAGILDANGAPSDPTTQRFERATAAVSALAGRSERIATR